MSWRQIALIGTAFVLIALIALMPLSFARALSGDWLGDGASTYGRIWDGRIYGAGVGPARFERVDVGLRPLPLLTGRAVFDWQLADPYARGEGEAVAGLGGYGVRNAQLTATMRALGLALPGVDPAESVQLDIETLTFGRDGCRAAAGDVRTAALVSFAASYDVTAPMLTGPLGCNQGNVTAELTGESGDMSLLLTVSVSPSGFWRWTAEARLPSDRLTAVFSAAGFTQDGEVWRSRGEGQL
jgi:general secretion pathway protein N